MLGDNLVMLRNICGYSQEEVAEKIGVSRQAYAKWETSSTYPNIENCRNLAELYGVSIDSLVNGESEENIGDIPPAPAGKNIWGSVSINERGQIVIPKEVREKYSLTAGQRLIVLSDDMGIALVKAEVFENHMKEILKLAHNKCD